MWGLYSEVRGWMEFLGVRWEMIKLLGKSRSKEKSSKWRGDKEGLRETAGRSLWKGGELAVVVGFEVACQSSMERTCEGRLHHCGQNPVNHLTVAVDLRWLLHTTHVD